MDLFLFSDLDSKKRLKALTGSELNGCSRDFTRTFMHLFQQAKCSHFDIFEGAFDSHELIHGEDLKIF